MSFDDLLSSEIDTKLGWLPDFDSYWRVPPAVDGKPRQGDSYRWDSRESGPPPIMEDGVVPPVRGAKDRPLGYPPLPDVLCQQLLLYLGFVLFFGSALSLIGYAEYNNYNGAIFTIRARGLNSLMSSTSQVFGSVFLGCFILDRKRVRRRVRAFYGWVLVFLMVLAVHIWAYFYQK
jgi:hypothetical protein